MKNFTNNFKQLTSRLSARWLIMALMLLLGTSSAWAATRTFSNGDYIYIKNFKPSGWGDCWIPSNGYAWAHMWGGTAGDKDYLFELVSGTAGSVGAIYRAQITTSGTYTSIIFTRNSTNSGPWNDKWNQTGTITLPASGDCATAFSADGTSATWSTYTPPCNPATITWGTISATMSKGSTQTISTTLTSGAGSVTYTSSNTDVITVSGAKLTAVGNGTATITANHTTVSSGYCTAQSITKSVTVSTVIPSGTKLYFDFSKATAWGTGHFLSIVAAANSSYTANNSNTSGANSYTPKSDAWVALTYECDGIYSYTTTSDISTGISLWSTNENSYDQVWQTDVILNIKASEFDSAKRCYTLGSTYTTNAGRQTDCFGGSWGSTIPHCCTPPTITLTNNTVTYNGNPQKPTITIEGGATPTTVKYDGTEYTNGPTNAGTYTVTVWANANGNYCELEGDEATSSFTINQKTPESTDFTYTTSKTYNKTALSADVAWKTGTGSGQITTYYKVQGADDNTYSNTAPTNAGTYTVAVTTAADGNYGLVTKLPLGDFEIKQANQETLTISNATTSLCASSVTLTTSGGSGEGAVSYEITANSAGASINGSTLTATQSGSVTVEATKAADNNYNKITSATKTFTFTLLSAPTFTEQSATACELTAFNLNNLFTRNDGGAGTLEWYTVNNDTKVNTPASVTIEETTQYYAKVKDGNCYSGKSANVTVTINTPIISGITITPSTNSITVNATIAGSDLNSMQVEVAVGDDWANAIEGATSLTGSNSYSCTVNGLQEGTTYNVRVGADTKKCSGSFTYAAIQETTTTCSAKPAPAITEKATICPNTDTPLSNFNNGVANVVWYSDQGCTQPVTTVNISEDKSYYARTEGGICYSEVAQLDLSVYTAPAQPDITPSGTITVGQGKTATITVNNHNAYVTYTCYQGLNVVGSWNGATLSIVAGSTLGKTEYRIVASHPNCPNLTEETPFTIDVTESGAKIAQLGNLSLCTNIVTDFVPMYVTNDGIADFADQGATKVKSYTWQYSTDGISWEACSTSNYNATAVGMENGGEKCNNWRAAKTGQYRCLITYATDNDVEVGSQPSNVLTVTASSGTAPAVNAFGDLPIISVNTGTNAFPSDPASGYPSADADNMKKKISVDVKIFDKQGKVHYDRKARMNYRGSSSLNFQKKSYAFVTGKEKTKNTAGDVDTGKANLFGLSNGAKDKDWVLYAANPDPSMMRNRLAFDLYKEMTGKWGVSSMYVELIINNEYKGVYVLMDKVTMNEKRVNITATNGFIVKYDKTDKVDRVENQSGDQKTFATTRTGTGVNGRYPDGITSYGTQIDQRFEIEYPEKEDIEEAGGNWTQTYTIIKDRFEEFEEALAEKDYATVRKLIDYDSWADWFIISEYIKNQDTYRASNIFVFNGDKIEAWPLWDQELSFNNQTRVAHGSESTSGLMATTSSIYSDAFKAVFWLTGGGANGDGGLLGDPCFVALVKSKWEGYKANQLSASAIANKVNAYHTELGNAQAREEARWPYTGAKRGLTSKGATTGYYGKNEGNEVGYTSSKNAITSWATGRIAGFTTALDNYTTEDLIFGISPETAPATPWQPVILTVSVPEGFEYTIAYPELTQAGAIVTKTNDIYQVKIPRPTGDGWTTGGNGTDVNGNATAQPKTFTVTASITKSTENACGSVNKDEATATITLTDVTEDCDPEIVKQQQ